MANKKIIYTHELPYHLSARTNNKEPFRLPLLEVWRIFSFGLRHIQGKYRFKIFGFVLMNNHYHLIGQCCEEFPLSVVMHWFQLNITKMLNVGSERINRVFGAPYDASLIESTTYFANAYKYVAQNPMRAGLCKDIQVYPFSSFSNFYAKNPTFGLSGLSDFDVRFPDGQKNILEWLNQPLNEDYSKLIKSGLKKNQFKIAKINKKPHPLSKKIC